MPNSSKAARLATGHRYGSTGSGRIGRSVSYSDAAPELLQRAIVAVTTAGDAITFGRTSDGGAYYIGVLADGTLERWYLDASADLTDALEGISQAGEALIV